VYGWSLHLIGAVWSSIIHLFLALYLAKIATRKLLQRHQDTEALISAAVNFPEVRSTSEDQLPPPLVSRNVNETQNPVYYKELRALLNFKE